jgi:zinc transport system ATP-binding protein
MEEMKTLIRIERIDAGYNATPVLKNVSLSIMEHDFIGIIGPNGGGKTTLMKVLTGLLKPLKGTIEYFIDRSDIGYLPQGIQVDAQFPITVEEVVASGLGKRSGLTGRIRKEERSHLISTMERVGVATLKNRSVGELSGGELQRTMLARALASSPKLLVLDEPDSHVDNRFESELYSLLKQLNESVTILLVSHDIGIISQYIKTIACVNRDLHYHPSNEISEEQLKVYNCPIEVITHGPVPHRVMKTHKS